MLTAPASAATRSTAAPDTIKMEDCTHNGVSYVSPSLGTCYLHQMTFDYNKQSTIGFCAEKGKGMGWSLEGHTWDNPRSVSDPTVSTMMAYYYAHSTGVFTDEAHALGVDDVWDSGYAWTMNAWVSTFTRKQPDISMFSQVLWSAICVLLSISAGAVGTGSFLTRWRVLA